MKKSLNALLLTTAVFINLTSIQRLSAQAFEIHNTFATVKTEEFLTNLITPGLVINKAKIDNTIANVLTIINNTTKEEYKGLGIWYAVANQTEETQLAAWKTRCKACFDQLNMYEPNMINFVKLFSFVDKEHQKDFCLQSIGLRWSWLFGQESSKIKR